MGELVELGGGVAALYAHALAIEREAAERYGELAARMADKGNDAVARLFAWLDADAPESAAHDLLFQLMIPHDALEIALGAELRAQAFFEQVLEHTADPRPREALARTPDPHVDWEQVFAQR